MLAIVETGKKKKPGRPTSSLSQRLKHRYFGRISAVTATPIRTTVLRHRIAELLAPDATVLDAGCGRRAPTLAHFRGRARRLIGVDQVAFADAPDDLELRQRDLADTGSLPTRSI